ncbi:hypothetical protein NQ314_001088 [Rhamnusium bicolor]|uniref:Uncharacterized protein n=1 Tax=Rhamnusium bicolor TaxID=1586634 RepID=A0AAV8ZW69_9CUCU|nr:hypothetical protein NQ314_001088 [Rhamnusium bicolor]
MQRKLPLLVENIEKTLTDLERFRRIVSSQWATEIGSIALKDLIKKCATKPKLLPVTEDIVKLKSYVENIAEENYKQLKISKSMDSYKLLAESTLVLTIIHNRKRVGDIQYLDLNSYKQQIDYTEQSMPQTELGSSLSENEKILTKHYKKIVAIGKGSRAVTILIPKVLQKFFSTICSLRTNSTWFSPDNTYFFTYPQSMRWIDGCAVIRKYAKMCGAKASEPAYFLPIKETYSNGYPSTKLKKQ